MAETYLLITTPQGRKQIPLGNQPLTIGRHADNKLVLADNMASRFHCVIEPKGGNRWVLRDLNSSNGTTIGGKRIGTVTLGTGQPFVIGTTTLSIVDPTSPATKADGRPDLSATISGGEEELEVLTEDDVVEVVDDDQAIAMDTDGPDMSAIDVETDDAGITGVTPNSEDAGKFEQTLEVLAESLPSKPFGENEISLVSSRGQLMHAARKSGSGKSQQREAVDILRLILLICTRSRASDIHLEPKTDYFQLRIRVDGLLVDAARVPNEYGVKLAAIVKVLSDIDISQRTSVQEGHFAAKVPGPDAQKTPRRIDYRVSFAPGMFGQKLVLRIFDANNAPLDVTQLQLPSSMLIGVQRELQKEAGMLLVCGPTGSGKTTTLYALVRSSDVTHRNVVTIEDPVEVQIEGVTQMPVDETQGKGFATLLRSVLRQDPDAILVGEIRDPETARTAMQAAITGHLVFSTVHTTSTIGTVFRLLDLGVEPYLIAQGLHVVIAQRLVRQLCQFCKKPVWPTADQISTMGRAGEGVSQIFVARGCTRCLGTGYAGRRAFFEMLRTTDELRDVITSPNRTMEEIKRVVGGDNFMMLDQAGFQLVREGLASFDEIEQAVGK